MIDFSSLDKLAGEKESSPVPMPFIKEKAKESPKKLLSDVEMAIRRGEPSGRVLLKALMTISVLANDEAFFSRTAAEVLSIQGEALGEPGLVSLMLEETTRRLNVMRENYDKGIITQASLETVRDTIRALEVRQKQLQEERKTEIFLEGVKRRREGKKPSLFLFGIKKNNCEIVGKECT